MGKDVKTALAGPPLRDWLRHNAPRFPPAPALDGPEGVVDYAHLLHEVQALAARLSASGFRPGDRIGIAATRSNASVIAILAAVDAGLGYVPLDLAYPADRLQMMLADAQVRAVLGSPEALAALRDAVGAFPTLEAPAPVATPPHGAADDLLYVLFTSGSTGRPKGVAMGQRPLANLVAWHAAHPRLGQAARTLQFAPLSFDVHCQEIFSAVATGSTLVILPDADRRDPARLHAALQQKRVERVFLPYVALQMIAEAARDEVPPALRDVISAGEQLQVTPAIRSLFQRLPGAELHNHYGPTETHVVTAHELRGDPAAWPDIPPIGLPLPYVQVALREEDGSGPTNAAQGELLLGGDTLAHGYLGRPELTAERFLENPPGFPGRWYATGDLVRRDTDGTFTYLGRIDQQLKVDGFRIEPGEIELALMDHPAVQDAVVAAPDVPGAGRQLVAYLVLREAAADPAATFSALRAHLRGRVPEYMVPVRYVPLDRLPTTPSGKIDRRALPIPSAAALPQASDPRALVRAVWAELLGLPDLGEQQNLFDLGARSLLVLRFVARLRDAGITGISVADVYDRPTVAGLASLAMGGAASTKRQARRATTRRGSSTDGVGIAIVGMAVRTAGASDVDALWTRLLEGYQGLRLFAPHEIDPSVPQELRERPNFVAARGVLENAGRFDAAFFGISAREATLLDPQQRLLLELSWNALEDAGIDPSRTDQRIGVYAGTANNTYLPALRDEQPDLIRQSGEFAAMLASEKDYAATRVANRLDLRGPAVSIHTACSTGLVAVANAWHALDSGQCDVVVAGGATVIVPQEGGYLHVEGGMESADGRCRPFDAEASGTVFGSAGAVITMKRLEDALADGDAIYAVMRGVGLNNDGADKASFTAPSVSGQAGAIRAALERAGVSARSIGYVEAHGTGTALGDPIEVAALTRAWREDTADTQFCTLGSLKGNFGHTIAAAGVLGVVKAALALQREVIPGTLYFQKPNPHIDFTATPFRVTGANTPWPRGEVPRRAAVSSFGVGGTNAHVILEEAPLPATAALEPPQRWVLPLSARTAEGAQARARELAAHLQAHPDLPLSEVAATLMRGRKPMAQRLAVVARDIPEAVAALTQARSTTAAVDQPRLVYLFPGQGSQHPGMARGLHAEVPAFREALDRCLTQLETLLPKAAFRHWLLEADPKDAAAGAALANTLHAQPALFSMSYALCAWLDSLGLQPDAMIGHSIGEYAAACRAGVFSAEDALAAVVARAQAMAAQPPGSMLAVRAAREAVAPYLADGIEIAGVNAPQLTVVAGSHAAIDALAQRLDGTPVEGTRLKVSHAFHSAIMDGALPAVAAGVARARLSAPAITTYSCISGQPLTAAEATDPQYWARQVRATVQFSPAVMAELERGDAVFVEVGPGQALTALLRQHRTGQDKPPRIVPVLGAASQPGDPALQALSALGALWCAGVEIAWPVAASARRPHLPGYPFAGDTHWFKRRVGPAAVAAFAASASPAAAMLSELPSTELPVPLPVPVTPMSRLPRIEQELTRILSDVSGVPAEEMDADATLVDQGLDSLSLTQATLELERVFGVKVRLRRLMEDLDTVGKLVTFFDGEMPADKFAPPPVAAAPMAVVAPTASAGATGYATLPTLPAMTTSPANGGLLQQVIQQQMQLMSQQLALLAGQPAGMPVGLPAPAVPAQAPAPAAAAPTPAPAAATDLAQPDKKALIEKPFGAAARITLERKSEFTPAQRQWVEDFIQRYVARSGSSKQMSQKYRKVMADPRVVTGFNPMWKDLVYPIVADRSKGARVWDIDGNEYIDLLSCFGANLLGYQPDALLDAMVKQLHAGIEVGPQHPMAGEVAELIAEFTGMDRVAFCNTGSEAVMGAMRIARTVTGRKTIAIFTNSYHGIFDEVIVRGTKQLRSLSAAPGILANAVENVLVLDWNSEDSLRILRERGHELAAIMTEPVQNKYPTIQPREFMKELRKIADDAGCALIFDEVVTGFRLAPGGAQEFYGVRADIATYGKIIGGGLPFAAIAGGTQWLDALDGGHWQYGDDSYPEAGVTYFAGTFVRHPLALAAAKASLLHLKAGGRALYDRLNGRTQSLIDRLNAAFAVRGAPVRAVHCASLWRLQWDDDQKYVSLFYYLSRFSGLHLYEQFGHFVTEAMGEAETDRIFQVFTNALDELMTLGLITPRPGSPGGSRKLPPTTTPDTVAATPARTEPAPLTPGQTERWLAAGFDSNARRALNESFCLRLEGPVQREALEAALRDVFLRHEAFSTRFEADEPLQLLQPGAAPAIHAVDLRHEADTAAALDRYCDEWSRHDFALDQAPLMRVSLLQMADGALVLHLVVSHLVFDGWATPVFLADLAFAYRARAAGTSPAWAAPPESPQDFSAREQARWEGNDGVTAQGYWKAQLASPPAPLALGDREPPARREYLGDTVRASVTGALLDSLRTIAGKNRSTMFQLLLAAVARLVTQRTGRTDFVISIPYASQSLERHGPLIADGVLDLPVRIKAPAEAGFTALLAHVRSQVLDALEYPLATQGSVARAVGVTSAGNRPPLTGVFFNLNPRLDVKGFEPLAARVHEGRKRGLLGEVIFNFYDSPAELTLDLHYSTEFFSDSRARELVDALQSVLREVAGTPVAVAEQSAQPAAQPAPALSKADLERLSRWNATGREYETGLRLGDLILRTVTQHPNATAVRFEGRSVTYAELDAMAWGIAAQLRAGGIRPGELVGVCLDRSIELVAALVGVVYSGGAYVPLDPAYPRERLTHMCEDARMQLVVTRAGELSRTRDAFPAGIRFVTLTGSESAPRGTLVGTPDDAAYVIFTSGSTGRPKGAMNAHKGIVNRLQWMQEEYQLTPADRVIQKTPYSFDVSVWEFFWPLMTGATIIVAKPDGHRDAGYLAQLIHDEKVSVLHFVPSMLRLFLEEPRGHQCGSVRQVLCSGEALPLDAVERFFEMLPRARLGNLYGPTEAAVDVTFWNCQPADPRKIVPIGRPIANTRMYVLGERLELLPVGQEGELYIGGVQVGMGYMSRPDLTAERFLPDPYNPGGRMYKTGDVGRWLDDGAIEYLGRADHQVKIRGNRIELGEIEATLLTHPQVAHAVVTARDFGSGDVRLVAYAVPRGAMPDNAAMKVHLAAQLPEYMLPQHFVQLAVMPLLPNGKVDRKALPAPEAPKPSGTAGAAPRGEVEQAVATIMQALLKLPDPLGVDDDFFAMGGHSLLAARVIAQVNKQLGTQLTLRALFEAPTVARLSAAISAERSGEAAAPKRAPVTQRPDQSRAPLTIMQERIRFIEELQPGRVVYNAPSAHRLSGKMDLLAFDRAFAEMVRRQPALRTSIVKEDGAYVQRVDEYSATLLPLEDLSALPAKERAEALASRLDELTAQTFELDKGPLFKARLFRLAEDEHALFFMTHHVIWDGWSFDVLYTEISALYEAYLSNSPVALPPLQVTFGDYCAWHNTWLGSDELATQVKYWKQQFAQGGVPREVIGDFPRELAAGGRGSTEWMHIETDRVERIRDIAKRTGSTVSIVVLAMYAAIMAQWLDDPCPAIGMPVRGRTAAELEPIMGFFNNMLPIRLPVNPSASALDWIKTVRQQMVSGFASQDAPFEVLARELDAGDGGPTRLYQVMFSFQDARARQTTWGPLAHERIPLLQKGATEDVNLWMVEVPNGIEGGVQYNPDIFLPGTATALRDRLLAVLDDMSGNPDQTLAELVSARATELDHLRKWNAPLVAAAERDVLDALRDHAARTPDRAAIADQSERVSYRELARRVDAFASSLQHEVAGHAGTVAVAIADPLAGIVAGLGVLQSGARLLTLDPAQGTAALAAAVRTNGATVLVTGAENAAGAGSARWVDARLVHGARNPAHKASDTARSAAPVHAQAAASRAEINALLAAQAGLFHVLPTEKVVCLDGPSRGLQFVEALGALLEGAEFLLVPAAIAGDALALDALFTKDAAGVVHLPGRSWKALLDHGAGRSLPVVALVDATDADIALVDRLLKAGATVVSVHRPCQSAFPMTAGLLATTRDVQLLGRPLLKGALSVTDAKGVIVPPGVPGRINVVLPEGTAVPTGLRGRWRADGALQWIGSSPDTAFVDGSRIDLAGLEALLRSQPGVTAATVAVLPDETSHRRVTAWVSLQDGASAGESALAQAVASALPMGAAEPSVIVVEKAGRLPDGSINPLLLSAARKPKAASAGDAPLTPTEQAVARAWEAVLGLSVVTRQDNFFDIGGTSLLAMQVIARLDGELGRQVSPRRYVTDTLAQLAAGYDASEGQSPGTSAAPVEKPIGLLRRLGGLMRRT